MAEELVAQEALFPSVSVLPFGALEASLSTRLYCSFRVHAADFSDVPGLQLWTGSVALKPRLE